MTKSAYPKLIMVRHGESIWNKENVFTGWIDIPLSAKGIEESLQCGELLKNYPIDVAFTSTLIRSQMTTFLALSRHSSGRFPVVQHPRESTFEEWGTIYGEAIRAKCFPVYYCWQLNERMYGELQGQNKDEIAEKFGEEQFKLWRRSYDVAPPKGESLEMTAARSIPFFKETILPCLQEGKNVFICAHGNSIRAIRMFLDDISHQEIVKLEIATGVPIIYNYQNKKLSLQ